MFIATAIVAVLEPRLALLLFLLLLLAAAAPLVVGWLSLLPAEREPFAVPGADRVRKSRDAFAVFGFIHIMGRDQDRHTALGQLIDQVPECAACGGVHARCGFIEK